MTDLDKLIAAVEAGDEESAADWCRSLSRDAHDVGKTWPGYDAIKAFRGSLDAAKRLHDALLPGWCFQIDGNQCGLGYTCHVYDPPLTYVPTAESADPARAWLLAILRAVKAEG